MRQDTFHCEEIICLVEHFRPIELDTSHVGEVALIEHGELLDDYPLAFYSVGGLRLVTLKRYIRLL